KNMFNKLFTFNPLVLFWIPIFFAACGKKAKQWELKLIQMCEDKKITLPEFKAFKQTFEAEKGYTNEKWCIQKGKLDSTAFVEYLKKTEHCKIEWDAEKPVEYHIYIDGSDLTKGYIKKAGMSKTMNGILYEKIAKMVEKNKVNLCLMDSEAQCTKTQTFKDKEQLREYLEKDLSTELNKTTGLSSLFHRLIPKIAQRADKSNVIIFVSDLITSHYSDNARNALEMLNGIDIRDKSFYLLGYNVDFNGFYWFSNNRKANIQVQRPFYLLFIGTPQQIINLKKMDFWKENAIGEFFSLSPFETTAHVHLLKGKINARNVSIDIRNNQIRIDKPKDIKFTFDVSGLEDLESLYGEAYLLDKNNYELSDKNYKIDHISIEKEGENKKYRFVVTSAAPIPTQLSFSLKINNMPEWIKNNSLNISDEEKEKTKTFGLYELIANLVKNNKNTLHIFNIIIKD
ncbi:MAG: hypothetical protein RML38_01770, partial [Bacteroidia bacterium]|nr:hypothetical protein [Bacteroidia bacterium]